MRKSVIATFCLSAILLCVLFLSSCNDKVSVYDMLHATASYSVPGMFAHDMMGVPTEIIEQDEYDRTLFSFTTSDAVTGQERTVWVICQKMTKEKIYYYEDFNYSFSDDPDVIDSLKQQNDWGNPLDEQKFSVRRPKFNLSFAAPGISSTSNLERNRIVGAISKRYRYDNVNTGFCDADGHGNELWYIVAGEDEAVREFFAIVNSDYEVEMLEIIDDTVDPDAIHQFKLDNGWVFG